MEAIIGKGLKATLYAWFWKLGYVWNKHWYEHFFDAWFWKLTTCRNVTEKTPTTSPAPLFFHRLFIFLGGKWKPNDWMEGWNQRGYEDMCGINIVINIPYGCFQRVGLVILIFWFRFLVLYVKFLGPPLYSYLSSKEDLKRSLY